MTRSRTSRRWRPVLVSPCAGRAAIESGPLAGGPGGAEQGRPGGLSYASMGIGSGGHLLAEMFRSRTRLEATHVPYKGSSQAVADAVAGRFDFFFNGIVDSLPLVREGKVRARPLPTRSVRRCCPTCRP